MPALGRYNAVAATVPREDGFSKPGPRSEARAGSARLRISRIQHAKIFGRKLLEAVAPGAQIIQKNNVTDVEFLDESLGLHDPGKIGGTHPAVDDWSGDAESGGNNAFLAKMLGHLAREFLDDELELRELLAGEALLEDGRERATLLREERQITLRPANVSREDQASPPPNLLNRFNEPIVASMGCTNVCRRVRAEDRILAGPNCLPDIAARWRSGRHSRRRGSDRRATRRPRRCRRDQRAWHRRGHNRSRASRKRCAWRPRNLRDS